VTVRWRRACRSGQGAPFRSRDGAALTQVRWSHPSTPCPTHAADPSHRTPFHAPSATLRQGVVIIATGKRRVIREELVTATTTGVKLGVLITCSVTLGATLANG
jgi:hypothetical protein